MSDDPTLPDGFPAQDAADLGFPACPWPPPADPYDGDGYCGFCGQDSRSWHAPWCHWADVRDWLTPPHPPGHASPADTLKVYGQ